MFHRPEFRISLATALGLLVATPMMAALPRPTLSSNGTAESFQIAQQLRFRVGNVQSSRGRTGGFARGGVCPNATESPYPVALAPVIEAERTISGQTVTESLMVLAETTDSHPSFYIYVPDTHISLAFFDVISEDGEIVADLEISLPSEGGVVQVTLPDSTPPLEEGKTYYWTFVLPCYDTGERFPGLETVGLVQRVAPEAGMMEQVNQTAPRDRPSLYANANLWYDTLTTLAALRYANPSDPQLQADWSSLLDSVNLAAIANAPLLSPDAITVEPIAMPSFDLDTP